MQIGDQKSQESIWLSLATHNPTVHISIEAQHKANVLHLNLTSLWLSFYRKKTPGVWGQRPQGFTALYIVHITDMADKNKPYLTCKCHDSTCSKKQESGMCHLRPCRWFRNGHAVFPDSTRILQVRKCISVIIFVKVRRGNRVGKPCALGAHARFDWGRLV